MTTFFFPFKPRADDLQSALVVQRNLDYLAQQLLKSLGSYDGGSALVTTGQSSVAVVFNKPITAPKVVASPTSPGPAWWISGKTTGGFVINLASAAGAGGVGFDWIARGG